MSPVRLRLLLAAGVVASLLFVAAVMASGATRRYADGIRTYNHATHWAY